MRTALLVLSLIATVFCDVDTHRYVKGEAVGLWANKVSDEEIIVGREGFFFCSLCFASFFFVLRQVGPFPNPQETYPYYSLPWCREEGELEHYHSEGLGETILGYNLVKYAASLCCCCRSFTSLLELQSRLLSRWT